MGLPVSMTRFTSTTSELPDEVNIGSAVSTGVDSSDCPSPGFSKPRDKMLIAVFPSLSISNPQAGHECSRTHSGLPDSTPHDAHSLVVPAGSTSTKCVPSRLHLFRASWWTCPTPLRLCSDYFQPIPASASRIIRITVVNYRSSPTPFPAMTGNSLQ